MEVGAPEILKILPNTFEYRTPQKYPGEDVIYQLRFNYKVIKEIWKGTKFTGSWRQRKTHKMQRATSSYELSNYRRVNAAAMTCKRRFNHGETLKRRKEHEQMKASSILKSYSIKD